jgi:hypothetical protein
MIVLEKNGLSQRRKERREKMKAMTYFLCSNYLGDLGVFAREVLDSKIQ